MGLGGSNGQRKTEGEKRKCNKRVRKTIHGFTFKE